MEFEEDLEDIDEIEEEKPKKEKERVWYRHHIRHVIPDKRKLRNLKQYQDMSDDEFESAFESKYSGAISSEDFEEQIKNKMDEFSKEYDLSDMKINDRETLRALIQAVIALEDLEQYLFQIRTSDGSINADNIYLFDRVNKVCTDLRSDISKLQNDLKISRRVRKSDADASFIDYLESVKEKARKFYESKMSYLICPKCNTLLGTIWTLYPEEAKNKIRLVCNREIDDGIKCDGEIVIGTKELLEKKGVNKDILPARME